MASFELISTGIYSQATGTRGSLSFVKDIVRVVDVHKSYRLGQTEVPALRNVNLTLRGGEFTAIVGASGSGKSTLLNVVGCIDNPDRGDVWIEDRRVKDLDDNAKSDLRNQKIGFIFQSFNLVPVLSVFENIEMPLLINPKIAKGERVDRVRQALKDVGIDNLEKNRPDQLSGGQRQRVAIARALAHDPILVLADEPTANLDSVNSEKIIDLMIELNQRRHVTFLFSTHDERLMKKVKRVIHIQDGVLQASGNLRELE